MFYEINGIPFEMTVKLSIYLSGYKSEVYFLNEDEKCYLMPIYRDDKFIDFELHLLKLKR